MLYLGKNINIQFLRNLHPVKCEFSHFSHFTHQHAYINKQKNPSTTIPAKYCKYSLLSMTTKDLKQTKDLQHKVFILRTHMAVFKQGLSVDNQSRQIKPLCLCSGKSHIRALYTVVYVLHICCIRRGCDTQATECKNCYFLREKKSFYRKDGKLLA